MIEVENTDVNIVRNLIPMRNHMPASAYGLKAISDWFIFLPCITIGLPCCIFLVNSAKIFGCYFQIFDYFIVLHLVLQTFSICI